MGSITPGDLYNILAFANDGSFLGAGSYAVSGFSDTWDDLRVAIEAIAPVTGTFENGRLVFREDSLTAGSGLSITGDGLLGGVSFGSNGDNRVTTSSILSTPLTAGTLLTALPEFDAVNAGDQLTFRMTNGAGANRDFLYTFGGTPGSLTTDTITDLVNAISAQPDMTATFDTNTNHIIVEDSTNAGTGVSFSFSMSDFVEVTGGIIHHQFDVVADAQSSFGGQTLGSSFTSATLQTYEYDLSSQEGASASVQSVDEAILRVDEARTEVGALLSRVESRISRLTAYGMAHESGRAALVEADFASEVAHRVSSEITAQSATQLFGNERRLRQTALLLLEGIARLN